MSNNGEYVDITNTSNYNINSNYISIANLNPFRYRGYYYDTETGLYYLNTRYYDSELGRFINADDISILNELQEELNGLNLYTYCFNNPVNDIDELGSWSWKKIFGWIVVAVVAVVAVATIVVGSIVSSGILGAALTGAGIGALTAMGTSIYVQGGFLNASPWSVVQSGLIGGTIGAISGIVSYGFGLIGQEIGKSIGMIFANTTHLSSGITFGKVFGTGLLMSIGSTIGKILGGFIGGTVTNYIFNYIQSNKLSTEEMLAEGFIGEIPGWILDTFKWLFSY